MKRISSPSRFVDGGTKAGADNNACTWWNGNGKRVERRRAAALALGLEESTVCPGPDAAALPARQQRRRPATVLRDRGSGVVGRDALCSESCESARPTTGKRAGGGGRKNKKKRTREGEDGRVEKKLLRRRRWGGERRRRGRSSRSPARP